MSARIVIERRRAGRSIVYVASCTTHQQAVTFIDYQAAVEHSEIGWCELCRAEGNNADIEVAGMFRCTGCGHPYESAVAAEACAGSDGYIEREARYSDPEEDCGA